MNGIRRTVGVLLAALPLVLLLASFLASMTRAREAQTAAIVMMALACVFACVNFHLSFLGPAVYSLRHGGMKGYRSASGIPMIGTLFMCIGTLLSFGSFSVALTGMIVFVIDTGGPGWLVFATWRESSLWDR